MHQPSAPASALLQVEQLLLEVWKTHGRNRQNEMFYGVWNKAPADSVSQANIQHPNNNVLQKPRILLQVVELPSICSPELLHSVLPTELLMVEPLEDLVGQGSGKMAKSIPYNICVYGFSNRIALQV